MQEKYSYTVDVSKDKYNILKIDYNNQSFYSASKYNTCREIDELIEKVQENINSPLIIIFGLSNGEYIDRLKDMELRGRVLIVDVFEYLIDKYENIVTNNKINIIQFEKWKKDNFYLLETEVIIIFYGNYLKVFKEEITLIKEGINKNILDNHVREVTIKQLSLNWIVNFLRNLSFTIKSKTINCYKDYYKNKPAIIVSAGPSLEKNIHLLKGNEDKFIIISGGRTLPTLKRLGIKVDFTCVLDPGEGSYDVIKDGLDYETTLAFTNNIHYKILEEYSGDAVYFSENKHDFLIHDLVSEKADELLQFGGSVAHTCTSLAKYIGCNEIIYVGQDLAYTNNKQHAACAAIVSDDDNNIIKHRLFVEDVYGNMVGTEDYLNVFRNSLEKYIEIIGVKEGLKFVNCSEGGAKIKGADFQTLESVIASKNEIIKKERVVIPDKVVDNKKLYYFLSDIKSNLDKLFSLSKKSVNKYKELKRFYKINKTKAKQILNELDIIDKEILKCSKGFHLINTLLHEIAKGINENYKRFDIKTDDERLDLVVKEGIELNEAIINNINGTMPVLVDVIKGLEKK